MGDIVQAFQLAAVHKSGAIVAVDRLAWLNKQHVRAGLADVLQQLRCVATNALVM